jgi:hypothetical protein
MAIRFHAGSLSPSSWKQKGIRSSFRDIGIRGLEHVGYAGAQKVQDPTFDNLGDERLKQSKNLNPTGGIISQFDYLYNPVGDITSWTVQQGPTTTANVYTLGYDASDQLRSAMLKNVQNGTVVKQYDYDYDDAGNRLTNQDGSTITTSSFNNLNQLTSQRGGGKMHVRGTVNEPSSVTVGGNPATVDANNKFDGVADEIIGSNTVPVVGTDASGNVKTNNYQLTVSGDAKTLTYDWTVISRMTARKRTNGMLPIG